MYLINLSLDVGRVELVFNGWGSFFLLLCPGVLFSSRNPGRTFHSIPFQFVLSKTRVVRVQLSSSSLVGQRKERYSVR